MSGTEDVEFTEGNSQPMSSDRVVELTEDDRRATLAMKREKAYVLSGIRKTKYKISDLVEKLRLMRIQWERIEKENAELEKRNSELLGLGSELSMQSEKLKAVIAENERILNGQKREIGVLKSVRTVLKADKEKLENGMFLPSDMRNIAAEYAGLRETSLNAIRDLAVDKERLEKSVRELALSDKAAIANALKECIMENLKLKVDLKTYKSLIIGISGEKSNVELRNKWFGEVEEHREREKIQKEKLDAEELAKSVKEWENYYADLEANERIFEETDNDMLPSLGSRPTLSNSRRESSNSRGKHW
ncbi:MAG: hypothetical protein Q8R82_00630 [Hyphomonadaceae bacterium]|nr:hypothetical protein [Hyphomonadaceae bacterium]